MPEEAAVQTEAPKIPNRLFFRIGDVAEITGVQRYVLRYWEGEFPMLSPRKGSNGQRQYRRKDVETVLEIKRLLYDSGFTIAGARKHLRDKARKPKRDRRAGPTLFAEPDEEGGELADIRNELRDILDLLD